jgi:hypothetical protein
MSYPTKYVVRVMGRVLASVMLVGRMYQCWCGKPEISILVFQYMTGYGGQKLER